MKEEFEDTKRIIRMRQSEDRQRYGQKKKDKPGKGQQGFSLASILLFSFMTYHRFRN
jgi:hypothetical protein